MKYSWELPYVLAILQTDEEVMHNALYEAIAAMEQRRLTPINAAEEIALAEQKPDCKCSSGKRPRSTSEFRC